MTSVSSLTPNEVIETPLQLHISMKRARRSNNCDECEFLRFPGLWANHNGTTACRRHRVEELSFAGYLPSSIPLVRRMKDPSIYTVRRTRLLHRATQATTKKCDISPMPSLSNRLKTMAIDRCGSF